MFYKKSVLIAVYNQYIKGTPLEIIGLHYRLSLWEVDEMIDHVNMIIL